jgi:copper homeostasis protein CutC
LKVLKKFKQIDRILTGGGPGSWPERKRRLHEWGEAMGPEIGLLVGGGLLDEEIADVMADKHFSELHVGRAARTPQENDGVLDGGKIALLKSRRGS